MSDRSWIKVGDEPHRFKYRRENPNSTGPPIIDQLAYVEEEKHSSYFHWETYTDHEKGAAPSREEAQALALDALGEK